MNTWTNYEAENRALEASNQALLQRVVELERENTALKEKERTTRQQAIALIEEAQALMRPQGEWEAEVEQLKVEIVRLRDVLDEAAAALLARPIRTDFDRTLAEQMRKKARQLDGSDANI